MREKIYIDQDIVKKLHSQGVSNNAIFLRHKIPISCIVQILKGIDRPFYYPKYRKKIDDEKMCTCCKSREKEGRFLCGDCRRKNIGVVGDGFGDGNRGYGHAKKNMI